MTQETDEFEIVFRPWITVKGRRIYAHTFGKKVFPLRVRKPRKD